MVMDPNVMRVDEFIFNTVVDWKEIYGGVEE